MSPVRSTLAALAALLLILPLGACARGETLVEVQVLDADRGTALLPVAFRGRDYLAGEPGHRFAVSLRNLSGERVLAVLSVDGVNAISGQTAAASQAGYVLEPWQRVEVRGWRKSHADVAEFYFSDLPDSFAARTGRPENVGVSGVQEKSQSRGSADAAGLASGEQARTESASPYAQRQQLGTGHGERRYDPVVQTQFERDSRWPNQRVALYYDSWVALAARGIVSPSPRGEPEPFPLGFVPDPR